MERTLKKWTERLLRLLFQIPRQHDAGIDKNRYKNRTYNRGFQPEFPGGGVHEGEHQGHHIHASQQDDADEGQNPF